MKIKLLTLTTLTLSFLLSSPPTAWGFNYCYVPGSYGPAFFSCSSCEDIGWKLNYVSSSNRGVCVDRNCEQMRNTSSDSEDVSCIKCKSGFYLKKQKGINLCDYCPQGATCDGWTITCSDGYYKNGSGCSPCHSSCKTCSGEKANNCTSCDSRAYLSGGQCVVCPANAVCDGSSYFSCDTGYIKSDGACVKEEQEPTKTNTVNSCPSRMTLSADGCCCVNK